MLILTWFCVVFVRLVNFHEFWTFVKFMGLMLIWWFFGEIWAFDAIYANINNWGSKELNWSHVRAFILLEFSIFWHWKFNISLSLEVVMWWLKLFWKEEKEISNFFVGHFFQFSSLLEEKEETRLQLHLVPSVVKHDLLSLFHQYLEL